MPAKITLITPPDIFQNDQRSLMFIDLDETDQEQITQLLKDDTNESFNIYFYSGETNIPWLLHSLSCSDYRLINLNNMSAVTSYLVGYILSKPNTYYITNDANIAELYSHINLGRVNNMNDFFERVLSGKE